MPLINGKCPECGATLKINDAATGEIRCPYYGGTYLVENVVNVSNVTNNISSEVVNVYSGGGDYDAKIIETSPSNYMDEIKIYESFGWKIESVSEAKDVVTFKRYKEMNNYRQLKSK